MNFIKSLWKKRKLSSHKGDNGKLLIIGGSKDYIGALCLAGIAALRSGVDVVTIAAPEKVAWAVNCLSPDLITFKLKGEKINKNHVKALLKLSQKFDAVLVGNGLGMKSKAFVNEFVKNCKKPLIIDADAIKCVNQPKNAILTPHRKEFEVYSGKKLTNNLKKDIEIVKKAAKTNVILLKGKVDIVATKDKVKLNKKGNPGMTKAGTGDVVAGLCAGLVAQGMDKFNAAYEAVKVVTTIGDKMKKNKGYSFIASDLLRDIKQYS
ncbi:NAD(P)H-hydrate dehydratase [Candidatus Woesearchaeota archaeon]|nr:MAG: NAD(P)H-hydrate dehydratase [Candidatus Woesearchaeota archaeon]